MVTDHGAKDGHACQIADHHAQGAHEYRQLGAGKVQDHIAHHQDGDRGNDAGGEALLVVDLAVEGGGHGGQHDGRGKYQDVVRHAQRLFIVQDQVGHKDLDGDAKHRKGAQHRVQQGIGPHHRGAEAVGHRGPVGVAGLAGAVTARSFFDEPKSQQADDKHHAADDQKDGGPALCPVQIKAHKSAKHHQDGHQRHHGVVALDAAAVGLVAPVRQPGIVGGIVGGGAKEGHDAVHDDHQADAQGKCRCRTAGQWCQDIHADKRKAQDADAPDHIAQADKQLALAQFVRQGTHQQGGHRGGHGAGPHHQRDVCRRGVKHLVDKYIEIHIFHHPGHLTDQAKDQHGCPKFASQFHR